MAARARELSDSYRHIYGVVRRIPRGRVATYGQVAILAGLARQPRLVGYAMHSLPNGTDVPWHRVINAQGRVSTRSGGGAGANRQRVLLEAEGLEFDAAGRISLARHGWKPRRAGRAVTARARAGSA